MPCGARYSRAFKTVAALVLGASAVIVAAAAQNDALDARSSRPPEAKIFAEGVISTPTDEFGPSFTPDGKTLYFGKSVPRSNLYVICYSRFVNGKWTEPQIAPFSGRYWDFDTFISPDGRRMVFVSDRPLPGSATSNHYNLWMVERTAAGWSEPAPLPPTINAVGHDQVFASLASDGTIYFNSDREGPKRIYRSRLLDGQYTEPERLASLEAPGMLLWEVSVAPDQSFLLLGALQRNGGYGSFDIYISFNRNGSFTPPINLGPKVNSKARDYSPRLSPDGRSLFYSSERGFATETLTKPLTYSELEEHLNSVRNGLGNIMQIELEPLKREALRSLREAKQ